MLLSSGGEGMTDELPSLRTSSEQPIHFCLKEFYTTRHSLSRGTVCLLTFLNAHLPPACKATISWSLIYEYELWLRESWLCRGCLQAAAGGCWELVERGWASPATGVSAADGVQRVPPVQGCPLRKAGLISQILTTSLISRKWGFWNVK